MSETQVQLLTKKQVAERLGMSERYVHDLIKRGELKATNYGRSVKIDINDLVAMIESRKQKYPVVALAG